MALSNLRRNPIDGTMSWRAIANESHTVAELFELPGVHGFILQDRPQAGSVTVTEDTTAATVFPIVTSAPLAGQVFVDFNENRGYCIFNSADTGKTFLVDYNGGGSNTTVDNIESLLPVGATAFTDLSDVPASYTGQTLKAVRVNAGETALEFYTPSAGGNPTQVVISTAGPHDNYDVGTQPETVVLVTTGAATEIQGFLSKSDWTRIIIANLTIYTLTVKHNGSGTPADNISMTDFTDALLQTGESIEIAYSVTAGQWAQIGQVRKSATIAKGVFAATTKTTPVAGDYFGITDSAASDELKKVDYADLETTILSATNARLAAFWVNFDGTGTPAIRTSYNVSSITDNGTGDYTINYTSSLTDANCAVAMANLGDGGVPEIMGIVSQAAASVRIEMKDGSNTNRDGSIVCVMGFR